MKQCLANNNSLKFSRTIFGILTLIAFLFNIPWLILIIGILMIIGVISIKYNFLYQFYFLILKKYSKDKPKLLKRDSQEISFACGMGGTLLF